MMHIIYGKRRVPIGIDEIFIACPSCEVHNPSDIMISSTYIHLFWVPAFPIRKDASLICKKCGLKRYDLDFDSRSLEGHKDLESKFKHPFYTYIGAAFFSSIIVFSILVKVLTKIS
jgi:hypothetical protein